MFSVKEELIVVGLEEYNSLALTMCEGSKETINIIERNIDNLLKAFCENIDIPPYEFFVGYLYYKSNRMYCLKKISFLINRKLIKKTIY